MTIIQFRLTGDDLDNLKREALLLGVNNNAAAKYMVRKHISLEHEKTRVLIASNIRILTILQRHIASSVSEDELNEIINLASKDEAEILKGLKFSI